jgi:hypothetical protein
MVPIATPCTIAPRLTKVSDQNDRAARVAGIAITIPLGVATKSGSWVRT